MRARNWILLGMIAAAMPAHAQYDRRGGGRASATFFVKDGFDGRSVSVDRPVRSFRQFDMNDKVSSIRIRGGRWLVCEDDDFRGRCEVIDRDIGQLSRIGMDDRISSARPLDDDRPGGGGNWGGGRPGPGPGYGGGNALPGGSWAASCRGGQMNGGVMVAQCRDTNGNWRPARITPRACRGGVGNRNGELVCE